MIDQMNLGGSFTLLGTSLTLKRMGYGAMQLAGKGVWRHFPSEIIWLGVRWYLRYPLSYRNLEEMMLERGLTVDQMNSRIVTYSRP